MRSAITVIAKSPVNGKVKTRLCPPLTPEQATELYRAFLLDSLNLIGGVDGAEAGILFTPDSAHEDFRALAPPHFFFMPQRGAGLGERLLNGFYDLFAAGYDAAIIMDADSPTLPRAHLRAMFDALKDPQCDVAIGGCEDGGYYALGMKHPHHVIFSEIAWSTDRVLAQTLQRAREANLTVACAPVWYDVDDGESLKRLRAELSDSASPLSRHTQQWLSANP